jgi:phosphohistidine swiveling domain-containing protein
MHIANDTSMQQVSLSAAGGKADTLRVLQAAGFNVPVFEMASASPAELEAAVERLGLPLAVRSSANCEDGVSTSFAGQFESYLNLQSLEAVQEAVLKCRNAVASASVLEYCGRLGIDGTKLRMHVILQAMIQPTLAGVAFGIDPATGEDRVVIEACEGIGDGLLAGRVSPLSNSHPLLVTYRQAITNLVHKVQAYLGHPQDVEFAIQDDVLYLLQSRPVTRVRFSADVGQWTNADFRDGGVSASVCSPLMASLYELVWNESLKQCLREIKLFREDFLASRSFFGRPYWNLGAVKDAVSVIPGFVEREFDDDLSVAIPYEGPGRTTPLSFRSLLRAIPTVAALPGFFRRRLREAQDLLAKFPVTESKLESRLENCDWLELVTKEYLHVEATYFRTIYAVSLAKMDFQDSFPQCSYPRLAAALPEIQHMAPLRAMRRFEQPPSLHDLKELICDFRHHCRFGIDVRYPRWDEDREFVSEMLSDISDARGTDPRPAYLTYREQCRQSLAWSKRRKFDRKLDRLREFVWLREELRDVSNRMYYWIRRKALQLAARRGVGDEIFFQTFSEIATDDRQCIEEQKRIFNTYRNFAAPNEIYSEPVATKLESDRNASDLGAVQYSGIAASGGVAVGVVFVARNVEEALRAEAGAILVCPYTEPGWTPVLNRVAAVVTETGGQLSHAAVICREYGIPAVLGVVSVTRNLRTGERWEVDGFRGVIRRPPNA